MTFIVKAEAKLGSTPTDGLYCFAFNESWFTDGFGVVTPPKLNTPLPGAPDGGPELSSGANFGAPGQVQITVPNAGNYYIAVQRNLTDTNVSWEGPIMPTPHTARTGWTAAASYGFAGRKTIGTKIAGASIGSPLPQPTLHVTSTTAGAGFDATGVLILVEPTTNTVIGSVTYAGKTGTAFTGCVYTGTYGGNLLSTTLVFQGYVSAADRRLVSVVDLASVAGDGDVAELWVYTTLDGTLYEHSRVGINSWAGSFAFVSTCAATFPVDPSGVYGLCPILVGAGSYSVPDWTEVDF